MDGMDALVAALAATGASPVPTPLGTGCSTLAGLLAGTLAGATVMDLGCAARSGLVSQLNGTWSEGSRAGTGLPGRDFSLEHPQMPVQACLKTLRHEGEV